MAISNITSILPHTIEYMMKCEHQFYLTGSRFFGNNTKSSDWDFFVQDSFDVRNWLAINGFKINKNSKYYSDGFCIDVYRKHIQYSTWIDVQVVSDASLKLKAQDLIKNNVPPVTLLNKTFARIVWSLTLESLSLNK